jgi:hypothetical protein
LVIIHEFKVEEARQELLRLLKKAPKPYEKLIRETLEKWDRVGEHLDTALTNHVFHTMTFQVFKGNLALFVRFRREKINKNESDWFLDRVSYGERVRWGFKWEYDLEKDLPLMHKRKVEERVVEGKIVR